MKQTYMGFLGGFTVTLYTLLILRCLPKEDPIPCLAFYLLDLHISRKVPADLSNVHSVSPGQAPLVIHRTIWQAEFNMPPALSATTWLNEVPIHYLIYVGFFHLENVLQVHLCCCWWQDFPLLYDWVLQRTACCFKSVSCGDSLHNYRDAMVSMNKGEDQSSCICSCLLGVSCSHFQQTWITSSP